MALKDITKPAVLKAIQECVRLGRESFLDKYGFGPAKLYRLVYDGRIYDSKAIVGVAHQYVRAGLGPLTSFSGGAKTVQPVLESLGFTVRVGRAELGDIVLPGEVDDNAFDPSNIEDARKRISRMIAQRRGQRAFRNNLFDAYGGRCAITGCEVPDVLEAAHIFPYRGEETNKVKNGLLLRVRPETLCRITEFSEHESNGRELDEGERVAVEVLPVFGQSAAAVEPGDGAFDLSLL